MGTERCRLLLLAERFIMHKTVCSNNSHHKQCMR